MKYHRKRLSFIGRAVKMIIQGLPYAVRLSVTAILRQDSNTSGLKDSTNYWEVERDDIIERANWLCEKVIVSPERLIKRMPAILNAHFAGEWAIYSCSMLAAALANISRIYPEERLRNLKRIEEIINIILSPVIRKYDTDSWGEDALETLAEGKSHMTYISILAWTISNYKLIGGDDKYDNLYYSCCEALNRRMLKSRDLNLPSFPYTPIFIPDMMFAIISLHNYSKLYDGRYVNIVEQWIAKAKTEWIHEKSGLLASMLYTSVRQRKNNRPIRGSYTALNCYCLTQIDDDFARVQYECMKNRLNSEVRIFDTNAVGIKEYLHKSPKLHFDVDAGPIFKGLSPSGSAFAIGSATYWKDWKFRKELLHTAELAGQTVRRKGKRHYMLGNLVLVGEAVTLAMRTNIKQDDTTDSITLDRN